MMKTVIWYVCVLACACVCGGGRSNWDIVFGRGNQHLPK